MSDLLTETSPVSEPPTTELIGQIAVLRENAKRLDNQERLESALERIEGAACLTVSEHAGMADELIGLYEQLGAVFDITRRLPHLRDEQQVAAMFKDTMAATFNRHEVAIAYPSGGLEVSRSESSKVPSTFNLQTFKP